MSDLTKVLKNIYVNDSEEMKPLVKVLQDTTSQCLKDLKVLRQNLTAAYIIGQQIVIKEDETYSLKLETDVRKENKQHLDVDQEQRKEEKILQDMLHLLSSDQNQHLRKEVNNNNLNNKQESSNFFKKLNNLIYKLMNIFNTKNTNTTPKVDINTIKPIELMKENINTLKLYQKDLKERTTALENLEVLQQEISKYKDRIQVNPKKYNQQHSMQGRITNKILELKKNKNDRFK